MKKFMCLLVLCAWSGLYADLNIAIVDVDLALNNSPQVNKIQRDLKAKYTPKQTKLIEQRKKITQAVNALRRDEAVLKASEVSKKKHDIEMMANHLQQMESMYQQEIYAEKSKKLEQLHRALQAAVKSVAHAQSIDLVINKPSVMYSRNVHDISHDVANALKKSA